jgi:23S rRNA (pseudouridine1915-N3)-methyltransferase
MRGSLLFIKGQSEPWAEAACDVYVKKLNAFLKFERRALKAKELGRKNSDEKKKLESQIIIDEIEKSDTVVLFDESGRAFKNSRDFSNRFVSILGRQSQRVVFVIGGPYGCSEQLKSKAHEIWSLSSLTLNHHLAQVTALEQIYRAFTIWKNLPYHND